MPKRWQQRPPGSNWGEFGDDDQHGRLNLLTPERRLRALQEVQTGEVFCLSHPLDRPGGNILNTGRFPPVFHPVFKPGGEVYFNLAMQETDPRYTDVGSDEAIMLYSQYSTHWDGFAHKGTMFDADGDGVAEKVSYNGFHLVDDAGRGLYGGTRRARAVGRRNGGDRRAGPRGDGGPAPSFRGRARGGDAGKCSSG